MRSAKEPRLYKPGGTVTFRTRKKQTKLVELMNASANLNDDILTALELFYFGASEGYNSATEHNGVTSLQQEELLAQLRRELHLEVAKMMQLQHPGQVQSGLQSHNKSPIAEIEETPRSLKHIEVHNKPVDRAAKEALGNGQEAGHSNATDEFTDEDDISAALDMLGDM